MTRHDDELAETAATGSLGGEGVAGVSGATANVKVAPPPAATRSPEPAGDETRSRWLLVVCCVAQFMVILDLSIVNVALPSIQSSLTFTAPQLQWVVNAYAITFAGFLMLGGRAADYFGQRRTFVVALVGFAIASLVGGAAPDHQVLIGARAAQGLAGALMAASSLAIITASFPPGPKLHRAIGIWAAMNGAGGAAGVLFGGILTDALSWRWVLLINPPIALAAAAVAYRVVVDRRRAADAAPRFDIAGALTLTVGQIVLVYGVVNGGLDGWGAAITLGPIIVGIALLALFGLIESRFAAAPLVPFKELTKPLKVSNTIVLLFSAALFPMWFISSLYLQQVLGLSPLNTGLTFLPMALTIMLVAQRAGGLVSRFGVRSVLGAGLIMMTVGLLLFVRIADSGSSVVYVMLPGLLTAAGIALSIVPSTIAATQGAKQGQAGLASGLVNTSRQVGGGLGLALLITLATELTTHQIGNRHGVLQALTDGFRLAYLIGAVLTAAAAIMTFVLVPKQAAVEGRRAPFAIAVAAVLAVFIAVGIATAGDRGAPIGAYVTKDTFKFVTQPKLRPPKFTARGKTDAGKLAPGYIFATSFYDLSHPPMIGQSGPYILDNHLQPVWFKPLPTNLVAGNLSLQTYNGKPALAWWQGVITNTGATLSGEYVVVDQHYRTVARLKGADGWDLTLHEIVIDGDNAWVTANKNIPRNLAKYGGAHNGAMIDSAVQEYNLKTGRLIRNWDALDHVPLSQSIATLPTNGFPWDAYHVNSIDLVGNGKFLVSMRNTWAAYLVDIRTGHIDWTLGGRHSDFKFGPGAEFQWQHNAVLYPGGLVTVFDDHCCQLTGGGTYVTPTAPSRGLVLKLDQRAHTATLGAEYPHYDGFDAAYMGSTEPLPNGNVFVGWGSQPAFSEYSDTGKQVIDVKLPYPDLSYRASVEQWIGRPLSAPAAAARREGGRTTVYASWNGATEVTAWRVVGSAGAGHPATLATAPRSGFETAIAVPSGSSSLQVEALDARGHVIGTSRPFSAGA